MKTNKNPNKKELEENWGIYCVMMVLVGCQIGNSGFETKEKTKDDSKRELTNRLIMYGSPDEKWIVFCCVMSYHRQQWKQVYKH